MNNHDMVDRALSKEELRTVKPDRREFKNIVRNKICIVLDDLKGSHNIGNIFRLSDAMLVEMVYLCGTTFKPPSQRIRKGSRGSEKWVPWEYREDIKELITELKSKNYQIVSVEISRNSLLYSEAEYNFPLCLIFGSEDKGMKSEVINLSDICVYLPVYGMCNSLNVSSTAGILLYHILK